jgi:hypothetical protein
MENKDPQHIIPPQHTGAESNTEASAQFENTEEAKSFFEQVKQRLLNVNRWHQYAGKATADFELTDEKGEPALRPVQKGDHFKIDIPGPGPVTGDGYDWVQVEAIDETIGNGDASLTIRVRPATNPQNERQDVAHFFTEEATSSFRVKLESNKVTAGVYGRNEKPNTAAETFVDKARNAAIATGAVTGFSKLQWKSLVNGLVKREEE